MNLYLLNTGLKLSISEALLISLIAMAIIMVLLVVIMAIVYLLKISLDGFDTTSSKLKSKLTQFLKRKKIDADDSESKVEESKSYALGTYGQIKLHNVKERDAAMIMAIVANKLNVPINKLRFISIKEIGTVEDNDEIQSYFKQ